jgi:uncharacterized membrane protein YecN with MAPEG domain
MTRRRTANMHALGSDSQLEEDAVDFANVVLYLPGLQVLLTCLACAVTSVLACWLLPSHAVSAVRTLTLTSIVGAACVHKPLQLGKAHGLSLVFAALRPAVLVYIACLVLEQLVHGCAASPEVTPSWRRVVFQTAILTMVVSGFMRANRPLAKTDVPFLITVLAILVVATLPPPAVALAGPLCEPVTLIGAAERLVRALTFGFVYVVFVYTSSPPTGLSGGINVILMRASAASVWTLGAAVPFLVLALPMCALAIFRRLRFRVDDDEEQRPLSPYSALPTRSPGEHENGCGGGGRPESPTTSAMTTPASAVGVSGIPLVLPMHSNGVSNLFGALSFREMGGTGNGGRNKAGNSKEAMAAVAAALEDGATNTVVSGND